MTAEPRARHRQDFSEYLHYTKCQGKARIICFDQRLFLRQNSTVMKISVIATIYNEGENMRRLLDSLVAQTLQPDEIIICDGGSRDDTVDQTRAYVDDGRLPMLRIFVESGANISRGRNLAIAEATGPIIAVTDAGVRLDSRWLEELVNPWDQQRDQPREQTTETGQEPSQPIGVAGFFLPDTDGPFQTAMAATVLPLTDDIDPDKFLPSSRSVAFTKAAWQTAGGYPEWLDYCEDLLFDFAINAQEPSQPSAFAWAPNAVAYFRPRSTLRSFWRQYYLYARGDGKADLWRKRQVIRYVTYLILLPLLIGLIASGGVAGWLGLIGLAFGFVAYCYRPWQRLFLLGYRLSATEILQTFLLVPTIRAVGDIARMMGYPVGLWWRWQNRGRSEVRWRGKLC